MAAVQEAVDPSDRRRAVVISANSFWNIANFRSQLIEGLSRAGYRVRIAAPAADENWAKAHGAGAVAIAIDRSGLNPLTDTALWLDYLHLFRGMRGGYFLGFTAKPNIYGSLAARLLQVTSIPNVSGLGTAFIRGGPLSLFMTLLYRLAFRHCPIVFFQNPDDRDLFIERRIIRPGQARILPGSGVDLTRFAPEPMPPEAGEPRFLFIGRLLGDKGVREFVEAARELRAEQPNWRFQLLGDVDRGNRTGIHSAEVRQWASEGVIEWLGQIDDIRPHIAAATAVVLPSYREGLPRSLLEAAAMARPLIATDVPGNRQLVEHGVNGLLCEARNPHSLACAMRTLGTLEPERRAEMGRAGRSLVERDYGVERVVGIYLEALAQLAGKAGVKTA